MSLVRPAEPVVPDDEQEKKKLQIMKDAEALNEVHREEYPWTSTDTNAKEEVIHHMLDHPKKKHLGVAGFEEAQKILSKVRYDAYQEHTKASYYRIPLKRLPEFMKNLAQSWDLDANQVQLIVGQGAAASSRIVENSFCFNVRTPQKDPETFWQHMATGRIAHLTEENGNMVVLAFYVLSVDFVLSKEQPAASNDVILFLTDKKNHGMETRTREILEGYYQNRAMEASRDNFSNIVLTPEERRAELKRLAKMSLSGDGADSGAVAKN